LQIVETPTQTSTYVIEAITMKTDHIDIMCTVPNSENGEFKDYIVSKEKMAELLVCDDEDIENLLLQSCLLQSTLQLKTVIAL